MTRMCGRVGFGPTTAYSRHCIVREPLTNAKAGDSAQNSTNPKNSSIFFGLGVKFVAILIALLTRELYHLIRQVLHGVRM